MTTIEEPDVFEAYARLRARLAADANVKRHGEHLLLVSRADLALILDVPLAHALSPAAVQRGVAAATRVGGMRGLGWTTGHRSQAIRAAIVAALGGER